MLRWYRSCSYFGGLVLLLGCTSTTKSEVRDLDAGVGGSAGSSGSSSSGGTSAGAAGTTGSGGTTSGGAAGSGGAISGGAAGSGGDSGSSAGTGGSGGTGGTSDCSSDQVRCDPNTGIPQRCENSVWQNQSACPFVCSAGVCTGECVPDSRRCDSNTAVPQLCSAGGAWQNQPACGSDRVCSAGECLCTASLTECAGACVQVNTSAAHCGACAHSCLGGECVASKCKPVEIAAGQAQPTSLAVSATHVYWMDYTNGVGNVKRVSKSGGTVQPLATDQGIPGSLALTSTEVYWGTLGSNSLGGVLRRVFRSNLDGTSRSEFAPYQNSVDSVVISDGVVYWNDRSVGAGTAFFSKPVGGTGGANPLGTDPGGVNMLTAAGGCLYYRAGTSVQSIVRLCPGSTGMGRFSSSTFLNFGRHNVADATMLYFGVEDRGVLRLPLTGTSQATDVVSGTDVRAPVVDGSFLYYIDGDTGGAPACTTNWYLYRVGKTPGSTRTELVPPPQDCPGSLAFDSEALYWINQQTGTIMKLAK
jgi:hypothetical protein